MATKTIKYDSMKLGDTPVFAYSFTAPYVGFDWSTVTIDGAITASVSPSNNTDAAVVRTGQALVVDASNNATWSMQPLPAESNSMTAGATYHVEVQLKQGTTNVVTPISGTILVEQDYVK